MSELTDRLRRAANNFRAGPNSLLMKQAADRIEELEADIAQCPFHGPVARWDLP